MESNESGRKVVAVAQGGSQRSTGLGAGVVGKPQIKAQAVRPQYGSNQTGGQIEARSGDRVAADASIDVRHQPAAPAFARIFIDSSSDASLGKTARNEEARVIRISHRNQPLQWDGQVAGALVT